MKHIITIRELIAKYPDKLDALFKKIDLDHPSLKTVKTLWSQEKKEEASRQLLEYYGQFSLKDRYAVQSDERVHSIPTSVDGILDHIYDFQDVSAKQKLRDGERLDWNWLGPNQDKEWGYQVNRHFFVFPLHTKFVETQEEKYAEYVDKVIQDWILVNPVPRIKVHNVPWRGLEAALRLHLSWPLAFYGEGNGSLLSPATRLLMLLSIWEHVQYLYWWHAFMGNHLVMQAYAVAVVASCWPEFKHKEKWLKKARKWMEKECLKRQVYPDGIQKENSSLIQLVTLSHFDPFIELMESMDMPTSTEYQAQIKKMWCYFAYALRPNGTVPLNNDANLYNLRQLCLKKAQEYKEPVWEYLITDGEGGKRPENSGSKFFPYGGQVFMRYISSEYNHWTFFDIGASGTSPTHLHYDKLHISINLAGRDILVDSGVYRHKKDHWRMNYFKHTRGHNCVLIDDRGQKLAKRFLRRPITESFYSNPKMVYARGEYSKGFGRICKWGVHERQVLYRKPSYWIVLDRIIFDKPPKKPRKITFLWHYHPDCIVEQDSLHIKTTNPDEPNLHIFNLLEKPWEITIHKGEAGENPQGWWSRQYNHKEEAVCVEFSVETSESLVVPWLLIPDEFHPSQVRGNLKKMDQDYCQIDVRSDVISEKVYFFWNHIARMPYRFPAKSYRGPCAIIPKNDDPLLVEFQDEKHPKPQ